MTKITRHSHLSILTSLLLFLLLGFAGCSPSTPAGTPTTSPLETQALPATETATPSPTPQPKNPKVILLAPSGVDQELSGQMQNLLSELATQSGLRFQLLPGLSDEQVQDVKIVVALPPAQGLAELAAAHPQVQFIAFGIPDVEPGVNLVVIAPQAERPDQAGFTAGYTAAAITPDYRAGVLTAAGVPESQALRQGFINGVFYYCGLCRPVYPPFPTEGYPITLELPDGASPADWQAVTNMLLSWQVGTVFVDPAIADPGLLEQLAQAGINLILAGPAPESVAQNTVASLETASPVQLFQAVWPGLLDGTSYPELQQQNLGFMEVNPDLLSPGRQHLVERMLVDLLAGYIDTGVDPSTWQGP